MAGCEARFRDRIEAGLCRLPIYLRYRNAAVLDLLRLLTALIRDNSLDCCVTGGMAYDALRGRFSRVHSDIDLICLASNRPFILASLQAAGFRLEDKSSYHAAAYTSDGLRVDLFSWVETAHQTVEMITDGIMVRLPRAFFNVSQSASLCGVHLTLPGNNHLKSILPFVDTLEDRRFLYNLETDLLVACEPRMEVVVRRITLEVHDCTDASAQ